MSRVEGNIFFPIFFLFLEKVIIDAINVIKTNFKQLSSIWLTNKARPITFQLKRKYIQLYTGRCNSCDEHTTKHSKHCLCYGIQSVFDPEKNISVLASHFGVISLTVDRILAIHLHLRYQELVTHKRVVSVVFDFGFFFYTTSYCSCLCHNYRIALLQSMRSCKTPHRYK